MCGLLGIAGLSCREDVEAALDLIAHRGPDGRGVYDDETVTLGHCRLAIIDREKGNQPFFSADGRYVIIHNGEIYNFPDLADRLRARGISLITRSDTETLLYWLIEFGIGGLAALNGMFAFALWDRQEKSLLLARDRLGIKPLYYREAGKRLLFASEIKALLPWIENPEPNPEAIFQYLALQNVVDDQTFFKGVRKLPPGCWLRWSPASSQTGTYWDVRPGADARWTFAEAVERFADVHAKAVKRHMIADVPVGAYLSSGVDSSSVVMAAAGLAREPLHTFTGAFVENEYYDERAGSRLVAERIGAHYHETVIRPEDYVGDIGKVIWHLDEPTLGTGALPQFEVSKLAARHLRVVLTGHGGDELFAGYQVNKAALFRDTARRSWLRALLSLAQIRRDEWTRVLYYLLYPVVDPDVRHGLFIMTPRNQWTEVLSRDFSRQVSGMDPLAPVRRLVEGRGYDAGEILTVLYLKTYLPTLFIQEDKVGMAHSIEARMPLCDNELIDLALELPLEVKLHGGELKAVPRRAFRDRLPSEIFGFAKRGFPTPFARWYRAAPVRALIEDLLLAPRGANRGIVDPAYARRLLAANDRSWTDHLGDYARANRIYALGMIELWHRVFIDRDGVADHRPGLRGGQFARNLR